MGIDIHMVFYAVMGNYIYAYITHQEVYRIITHDQLALNLAPVSKSVVNIQSR